MPKSAKPLLEYLFLVGYREAAIFDLGHGQRDWGVVTNEACLPAQGAESSAKAAELD